MHTRLRTTLASGLIAVLATAGVATTAWSDDRRGPDRHDGNRAWQGREAERRDRVRASEDRRKAERERAERRRKAARVEAEHRRKAERAHAERLRKAERREWEHHRQLDKHRAAAQWRFERDRGWRFEHRPGVWSPFFVWWTIDHRPVLRPHPVTRIVRYPTGYYELVGNGITVPFYWVWHPAVVVATPPPIPLPPPPPADYPFPADGLYIPPPPTG